METVLLILTTIAPRYGTQTRTTATTIRSGMRAITVARSSTRIRTTATGTESATPAMPAMPVRPAACRTACARTSPRCLVMIRVVRGRESILCVMRTAALGRVAYRAGPAASWGKWLATGKHTGITEVTLPTARRRTRARCAVTMLWRRRSSVMVATPFLVTAVMKTAGLRG